MLDPQFVEQAHEYVLGGLSKAEEMYFLLEMDRDAELRALVNEYEEIAVGLALTAPQVAPPPALKHAIKDALPRVQRARVLLFPTFMSLAAAAACLALVVLKNHQIQILAGQIASERSDMQRVVIQARNRESQEKLKESELTNRVAELEKQQAQMWAVNPGDIDLRELARFNGNKTPDEQVLLAWNRAKGEGVLLTKNVYAAPTAKDYQLWILSPKKNPISAGVVTSDGTGTVHYRFHSSTADVDESNLGFAISLEPQGGSVQPTGPILFISAPKS